LGPGSSAGTTEKCAAKSFTSSEERAPEHLAKDARVSKDVARAAPHARLTCGHGSTRIGTGNFGASGAG
jgi:hypothetical protein